MPRVTRTDMRWAETKYYDSGGNQVDKDGNLLVLVPRKQWKALQKAKSIKEVRKIMEDL